MSSVSDDEAVQQSTKSSGRGRVGHAKESMNQHKFVTHNYKRPTFCAHCGNLLVGVVKQGMRCKRCEIDVHEKCQEDLEKECIEMILGNHNFREKSYTKPTYCDFCEKLLVGVVNQGLKCTECSANVHERCQEKIEVSCSKVLARLGGRTRTSSGDKLQRNRGTRISQRRGKPNEKTPLASQAPAQEEEGSRDYSQMFQSMPESSENVPGQQASTSTAQTSEVKKTAPIPPATQLLHQQVGEVKTIIEQNIEKIELRHEKLEDLEKQSDNIVAGASQFKKQAEKLKTKYWFKNKKMWIGIGVVVLILVLIIVIVIVVKVKSGSKGTTSVSSTPKSVSA